MTNYHISPKMGLVLLSALLAGVPGFAVAEQVNIQTATLGQVQKTAEISTEELRRILAEQSATVLDARPYMEFAVGHIPGAANVSAKAGVPMSLYVSDVSEIERIVGGDKTTPIILYCNGPFCGKSNRLGEELLQAGFSNVRRYQLGAPVWRALGGVMQVEDTSARTIEQPGSTTPARPAITQAARCRTSSTYRMMRSPGLRTTGDSRWKITTRASLCLAARLRRHEQQQKALPKTPSTTSCSAQTHSASRSLRRDKVRHAGDAGG